MGCVWGLPLLTDRQCACQVMPAFGLGSWSVCLAGPSRVAQIRDAMMLLWDVVEVWQGQGQAGPD